MTMTTYKTLAFVFWVGCLINDIDTSRIILDAVLTANDDNVNMRVDCKISNDRCNGSVLSFDERSGKFCGTPSAINTSNNLSKSSNDKFNTLIFTFIA
jgi:hypothetical protein